MKPSHLPPGSTAKVGARLLTNVFLSCVVILFLATPMLSGTTKSKAAKSSQKSTTQASAKQSSNKKTTTVASNQSRRAKVEAEDGVASRSEKSDKGRAAENPF